MDDKRKIILFGHMEECFSCEPDLAEITEGEGIGQGRAAVQKSGCAIGKDEFGPGTQRALDFGQGFRLDLRFWCEIDISEEGEEQRYD